MLVLTRKQNEKIQIGDNITITVLRMKGKAVRLGIQAPAEFGVIRGELVLGDESDALESQSEDVSSSHGSLNANRGKIEKASLPNPKQWHSDSPVASADPPYVDHSAVTSQPKLTVTGWPR